MWSGLWHRLYDTKPVNSGGSITLCGGTVWCHEAVRRWRNEEVPIISEGLSGLANYTHCFWITGRSRFVTYQSAVAICHGATSYTGKQCPIIITSPSLCSRSVPWLGKSLSKLFHICLFCALCQTVLLQYTSISSHHRLVGVLLDCFHSYFFQVVPSNAQSWLRHCQYASISSHYHRVGICLDCFPS